MPDPTPDRLDRHLAGELSHREQRELAQAGLDDPDLFDLLTAAALVKATAGQPDGSVRRPVVEHVRPQRSRKPMLAAMLAAAAAIVALVVYRPISKPAPPETTGQPAGARPSGVDAAAVPPVGAGPRPEILVARSEAPVSGSATVFRSADSSSRLPKGSGVVSSAEAGEVTADVGSLDGVARGADLQVFRGSNTRRVGRLTVTMVFREHSKGHAVPAGSLEPGDRVELAPGMQVNALIEQATARLAVGDSSTARALAERAVANSVSPDVSSDLRRRALRRLGTLERRGAALADATRHLRSAVAAFDVAPAADAAARAETLNELGAALIEQGDYSEAQTVLERARPFAAGIAAAHVANNLGAIAALRGDRTGAASMYRSALALVDASTDAEPERRAIAKNLDAVSAQR